MSDGRKATDLTWKGSLTKTDWRPDQATGAGFWGGGGARASGRIQAKPQAAEAGSVVAKEPRLQPRTGIPA